jgi:transcriptional regulator with XRE-family HTH domain
MRAVVRKDDQDPGRVGLRERFIAARKALGISQLEVAVRAGIHPSTASMFERGAPVSRESLAKIAAALGLELATERRP